MRQASARALSRFPAIAALLVVSSVLAAGQTDASLQPRTPAAGTSVYVLGPDDQIAIQIPDVEEISDRPMKLDLNGDIKLPMIGRVHAGGLSPEQLEQEIASRLKQFVRKPDVTVTVTQYRSQPAVLVALAPSVSILGSVKNPGIREIQGRKTLIEVIAEAGGIADDAGYTVKIVRGLDSGRIPLASAKDDETGRFSSAEISLKQALDATNPAANLVILPQDVITIPRGRMVYVVGQVRNSGGYVLKERDGLSVLQAYTLAGGTERGASPKRARILRAAPDGGSRTEIPIDVTEILQAKAPDVPLQPDDILFIPSSGLKKGFLRVGEVLVGSAGYLIYRLP